MKPHISIIVPVCNVAPYIAECLESIRDQTYTNFEAILVDDGSTDASGRICDWYAQKDERFHVIHKINGGVSSARNVGIDTAKGEFIAFIDPDDYVGGNYLETLHRACTETKCDISQSGTYCLYQPEKMFRLNEDDAKSIMGTEAMINCLLYGGEMQGGVWGKLFRRDAIAGITFHENISLSEDLAFIVESITQANGITVRPEASYYYRLRSDSLCHGGISADRLFGAFEANIIARKALIQAAPHRRQEIEVCKRYFDLTSIVITLYTAARKGTQSRLYNMLHDTLQDKTEGE